MVSPSIANAIAINIRGDTLGVLLQKYINQYRAIEAMQAQIPLLNACWFLTAFAYYEILFRMRTSSCVTCSAGRQPATLCMQPMRIDPLSKSENGNWLYPCMAARQRGTGTTMQTRN